MQRPPESVAFALSATSAYNREHLLVDDCNAAGVDGRAVNQADV
jgi:hypothetical protein